MIFDRPAAITIIVGSIFFLIAAFLPISRVFVTPDTAGKLEIINAAPGQWTFAQIFFALGSLVTVLGVAMLANRMSGQSVSLYMYVATGLMGVGALLWSWHVYSRAVDPAAFAAGEVPIWLFAGYSLLTMVGLALIGFALLQIGLPPWVGWLAIGSAGLFLVLGLAFGDMPPFVYYVIMLTIGIMVYRAASTAAAIPG
jgi:hypothetical protein